MSDIGLSKTLDATLQNEHASASASAHASASVTPPELPAPTDVVGDATAHVDGALSAVGGAPAVGDVGGSVGLDAAFDGMLDVMGQLVAQFSGSLTALLGF